MNLDLDARRALITGSSVGLGLEIALALALSGSTVIICGRKEKRVQLAREEIISKIADEGLSSPFSRVYGYIVDGTDNQSVRNLVCDEIAPYGGVLDILINNIGGAPKFGRFKDLTDEDWINTFDLNVMTTVRFTRAALPLLKRSSYGGRIINIASLPAIQPGKFNPDYAASKAALVNLTKCLANEFSPIGIRANVLCPNTLNGTGLERNAEDKAKREVINVEEAKRKILENAAQKNPLGKVGELTDVANLVVFLASDAGQFINGQCIAIDGGESRGI